MDDLAFSVVMPANRADRYLLLATQSVERAIARFDAELIIVANGEARDQVQHLVMNDRTSLRTRVLVTEMRSLVHSLNLGIEHARGRYVARLDSDDVCTLDRFDWQLPLAEDCSADFLFSGARVVDEDGVATGELRASSFSLWRKCGLIHPTAFIRRETLLRLGGYGNLEYGEDYHLWIRAAAAGCEFRTDSKPVIDYRVHGEQATSRDKLAHTFATNAGTKITAGLRYARPAYLLGALIDGLLFSYRKVRSWLA